MSTTPSSIGSSTFASTVIPYVAASGCHVPPGHGVDPPTISAPAAGDPTGTVTTIAATSASHSARGGTQRFPIASPQAPARRSGSKRDSIEWRYHVLPTTVGPRARGCAMNDPIWPDAVWSDAVTQAAAI